MIRRAIAKLLGWQVVDLLWFDGKVARRLAHPTAFGSYAYAYSRTGRIGGVLLLPDGTCRGASYIDAWRAA